MPPTSPIAASPGLEEGTGGIPRYAEIQREIERKITTGEWAAGSRIPSEIELVDVYGCSRVTVNKALSGLAAAGLITRRRKAGSFVSAARVAEPLMRIRDIRTEVLSTDRAYRFEINNRSIRTIMDPIDAQHVGVAVGSRVLYLEVIHFADNLPFTLETRQINLEALPQAERAPFKDEAPTAWLTNNVSLTESEHSLRAITADATTAKQLQVTEGTACIAITQRSWRDGKLITFARLLYPGDRHRFVMRYQHSALLRSD